MAQTAEPILFDFVPQVPVVVQPHRGQISSYGGLLPIRQFDQRWNYTGRMARCLALAAFAASAAASEHRRREVQQVARQRAPERDALGFGQPANQQTV